MGVQRAQYILRCRRAGAIVIVVALVQMSLNMAWSVSDGMSDLGDIRIGLHLFLSVLATAQIVTGIWLRNVTDQAFGDFLAGDTGSAYSSHQDSRIEDGRPAGDGSARDTSAG